MNDSSAGLAAPVARGSANPPKYRERYHNGDDATLRLVGKGITFDTRGVNIKTQAASRDEVRHCVAAGVMGRRRAVG